MTDANPNPKTLRQSIEEHLKDLVDDETGRHFLNVPVALEAILAEVRKALPKPMDEPVFIPTQMPGFNQGWNAYEAKARETFE